MSRFPHLLDRAIELGIVLLLVFPPLAFGAVEPWARAIGQTLIFGVVAVWLVQLIWTPGRPSLGDQPRAVLGGRLRLSGMEWPGLLFVAVILFQLVPLPPALIEVVSPTTRDLFEASLPGYGTPADGSFRDLPSWLEERAVSGAGEVPSIPREPGATARAMPDAWFESEYSKWRPLSLTPAHTRHALSTLLAHFAFFVVVFNHFETRTHSKTYMGVIAGMAGLLSLIGILQSLTADNQLYWWRGAGRTASFGPFVNANNFAGWMELGLPIAAGLTVLLWQRRARRASGTLGGILLFGFITVLGATAFFLAKSRGAFVALLGALALALVLLALARRIRPRAVVLALAPVALVFALGVWIDGPTLRDGYGAIGEFSEEQSFRSRLKFTRATLAIAADFPVVGTGLGTFRETYYLYTPGTADRELAHAHNDYAQLAAESGAAGGLAAVWALILVLTRGVYRGLTRRSRSMAWFTVPAAIGVLALLIHSFVSFNLQIYSNSLLFVFLCAVLMRCAAEKRSGRSRSRS